MSYLDDLELQPGTRQWLHTVSETLGQGWTATLALELHDGRLIDLGPCGPASRSGDGPSKAQAEAEITRSSPRARTRQLRLGE